MNATEKKTPAWSEVKKSLAGMEKNELIGLVQDLFKLSGENKNFLAARFAGEEGREAMLEKYRQKIILQFYPKRGFGNPKASECRKAIRDYKKATEDFSGLIELMLTYVESGTQFTRDYGDIDEPFYSSLESVLEELTQLLLTPMGQSLYPRLQQRFLNLRDKARWMGWGYGDTITDQVGELETAYNEG